MPTTTYTPLANITLGSSAASVTFSSISQAYRDLVLVAAGTHASGNSAFSIRFNSDSGTNYSVVSMLGNGSSAISYNDGASNLLYSETAVGTSPIANFVVNVMDYSATDKHKTVLLRGNRSDSNTSATAGRWANTAAITTVVALPASGSFATGSTFALYGIAA